jgi:hypothetical protein
VLYPADLLDELARVFARAALDRYFAELQNSEMGSRATARAGSGADSRHDQHQQSEGADGLASPTAAATEP